MVKEKFRVINGAESFLIEGNEIGILISHGFMGTPQSVRFVAENLAKLGYTVLATRLKGHGTHHFDLENATKEEWFESLENDYKQLKQRCKSVFVIGQSMGGALTLQLANKYSDIDGIIVINSALSVPSYDYLRGASEPRFLEEGKPDIKDEKVYEITYSHAPLKSIHELQKVMDSTPALLSSIKSPVLVIKSAVDHVVPPENTDFIIKNIGSTIKKKLILQNSYHVATMDNDKEQIVEATHNFIQQQIGTNYYNQAL